MTSDLPGGWSRGPLAPAIGGGSAKGAAPQRRGSAGLLAAAAAQGDDALHGALDSHGSCMIHVWLMRGLCMDNVD